jgi:3-phenylpropionate/cinnamic acid dioxygenase small subunit
MKDPGFAVDNESLECLQRKQAIQDHLQRLCQAIDNFDCEAWADGFSSDCRYRMIPRENYDRGLPLCLIDDDRAGLLQRMELITELWQYEPFRETRMLSNVLVSAASEEAASATAAISVYRTNSEGESRLHMVARMEDLLLQVPGQGWKIKDRLVILESFKVHNNIILPV